ncbi:MAG: BrnA antitoxin family protein [Fibromonadales bacterium]|nr:BrnA antitoxin family protein [Fibromonadales bacterium]
MPIVRKTVNELLPADEKRLKALASIDDSEIDTSDIPALSAEQLARFVPAKLLNRSLYRPVKVPVKVNYDADILEWFKSFGKGYQTRMNSALREYMTANCLREPEPPKYNSSPKRKKK